MAEPIIVDELSIDVVTGETVYRHEKGFSTISATATVGDDAAIAALRESMAEKAQVTVRCAGLDVIGAVTRESAPSSKSSFVLSVLDVCYRKPD